MPERDLLLWQIRWLLYFYILDRAWKEIDPVWQAYYRALETGDWEAYRTAYSEVYA